MNKKQKLKYLQKVETISTIIKNNMIEANRQLENLQNKIGIELFEDFNEVQDLTETILEWTQKINIKELLKDLKMGYKLIQKIEKDLKIKLNQKKISQKISNVIKQHIAPPKKSQGEQLLFGYIPKMILFQKGIDEYDKLFKNNKRQFDSFFIKSIDHKVYLILENQEQEQAIFQVTPKVESQSYILKYIEDLSLIEREE
ncbi:hypothetical protein LCGC14_1400730 [marine sediment metagenome]|uniref:Uncharacterized protein n=1 Tax=marine sediment metagenome TaxID=412755 RepID=A0A0F9JX65_9ZZZZ